MIENALISGLLDTKHAKIFHVILFSIKFYKVQSVVSKMKAPSHHKIPTPPPCTSVWWKGCSKIYNERPPSLFLTNPDPPPCTSVRGRGVYENACERGTPLIIWQLEKVDPPPPPSMEGGPPADSFRLPNDSLQQNARCCKLTDLPSVFRLRAGLRFAGF